MKKQKLFSFGLTVILLFFSRFRVFAHGADGDETMMGARFNNWFSGYLGIYGWIMFAVMILFIVGITLLIVFLVRRGVVKGKLYMDPLEELKASYARGEIDREEYLRMRDDLRD